VTGRREASSVTIGEVAGNDGATPRRDLSVKTPRPAAQRYANTSWLGSPVTLIEGSLPAIADGLPRFERRPFCVTTGLVALTSDNPNFDVVVRLPTEGNGSEIPVGVVSKEYALVQHGEVLGIAFQSLKENEIDAESIEAQALLTQFGERMELVLTLPERYGHDPGDGHRLALQIHCFNSVDGSTRFTLLIGWYRFVCSNGLVVGTTTARLRQIHNSALDLLAITATIRNGLKVANADRNHFRKWLRTPVTHDRFRRWVDGDLSRKWGVKAAARTYHIVNTGSDVRLTRPFEKALPSERTVEATLAVPGADPGSERNAYAVSQALAWVAQTRRDLHECTAWMLQAPTLIHSLLRGRHLVR
jgi:uncharacterized protein DUF932